ncbi:MAG: ABC transporter substrate-binding protein [Chloroflexi bacterium]|nr:ABC transporter substrate-binding protein [Chloroflexota bacterium]
MVKRRAWAAGLAAFAAVLLTGCGSSTPATPGGASGSAPAAPSSGAPAAGGAPAAPAQPVKGGVINIVQTQSVAGVDPHMGQASHISWPIMGERLIRVNPKTWELMPSMAEKWSYSTDGKTLTVNLRKGVKFFNLPPVNGRELEARDIVYSLKSISGQLYPNLPQVRFPRKSILEGLDTVEAVDKYTVKITLKQPTAAFLNGLADYRVPIIPENLREDFGADLEGLQRLIPERQISAGPYFLKEYKEGVSAKFEAFKDYWDGAPHTDAVTWTWIVDRSTQLAAFASGQIDIFAPAQREELTMLQNAVPKAGYFQAPGGCFNHMRVNLARKPFDNPKVRRALYLAIDRQQIGDDWVGKGLWKYGGTLPFLYKEAISQEELVKLPGYRTPKSLDWDEARKLMAEAGLPNGFETKLMVADTTGTAWGIDVAVYLKNQIEKGIPGMKVNLDVAAGGQVTVQKRHNEGDFDMSNYCFIHEGDPGSMMYTTFHSKSGRNYSKWSDAKGDDLIDRMSKEIDGAKRTALLKEAQLYFMDGGPIMPTIGQVGETLTQPWLKGYDAISGDATTVSPAAIWYHKLWVDKKG